MTPSEMRAAIERGKALAAYKGLLETIALIDFLHPNATRAQIIRAAQFMLREYPCDIGYSDDE